MTKLNPAIEAKRFLINFAGLFLIQKSGTLNISTAPQAPKTGRINLKRTKEKRLLSEAAIGTGKCSEIQKRRSD